MERHITLPLTREEARTIKSGEQLLLSGVIYTARDAAHKRLCELVEKGEPLPFDIKNATIYYVGPTPAKPGQVIGCIHSITTEACFVIPVKLNALSSVQRNIFRVSEFSFSALPFIIR